MTLGLKVPMWNNRIPYRLGKWVGLGKGVGLGKRVGIGKRVGLGKGAGLPIGACNLAHTTQRVGLSTSNGRGQGYL